MGAVITKAIPRDANRVPLQITIPTRAIAITYDATISASTTVTLNASTSILEVSAISQGIFMKWGGAASSSSFDEYIQPGSTRHYAVPSGETSVQFIEQAASATLICIEK